MRRILFYFSTTFLVLIISCHTTEKKETVARLSVENPTQPELSKYKTAYFASGCFWCVEAIFQSVKGVKEVISGYSGGNEPNPTYEQVGSGQTTHAEAVEVYYDPKIVRYETLVKVFFGSHDPTTLNRQGPDRGSQYRSIAFYKNKEEKKIIETYIKKLEAEKVYDNEIVTQVVPFKVFYKAEDYHQEYEKLHPNNPYVQRVSIPRLKAFQKKYPELLKETH
ncbi:peptide-methionine (S)-S-oxide reductase MsrA [Leptobacterium sp. I13]|uniref:peptide-methionine (S)-S-oxide reductase MsrA n=1 Tax=Leptobacterium meishanense TaxID=3128904 RepID=UPI0030EE7E28